jgi:uncharacterized phage protein (TIGR02218 family)
MPVSAEMKTHLAGTVTLGVFMKITAKDGDIIRVWNGTRNKIVDGETYYAYPLAPTQLQTANGLKSDNFDVTAVYEGLFTAATLRAKKWQGARVEYRVLNYKDFTMGHAERRVAFLGKTEVGRHGAKVELNSLASKLGEPWGRSCNADCDVDRLGDARCGVDIEGVTEQGYTITIPATVISVLNRQQFTVEFDSDIKPGFPAVTEAPDDFYKRGEYLFTSGNNEGAQGLILNNEGNGLTLYLSANYTVQMGDQLELLAGCDRKVFTCRNKYANTERNRGFWMLPGRSKVFQIPD